MSYLTTNSNDINLKVFSGEVLTAFDKKNIGLNYVMVRTLKEGKSAQFPVIGNITEDDIKTHTPGTDIEVTAMQMAERTITIDQRVYVADFLDDYEYKMSHFEYRGEIAKRQGEALATKIDKAIFAGVADTVLMTPVVGQSAGTIVDNADVASTDKEVAGDAIVESIFELSNDFNKKDVPDSGRVFICTQDTYYKLVLSSKAVNRDFTSGNGGIDTGKVLKIAGVSIIPTNHLPSSLNGKTLHGLYFTPEAFGVVKFMDIASEANYIPEKLGTLLTSYYALGMGGLNPTCAGALVG